MVDKLTRRLVQYKFMSLVILLVLYFIALECQHENIMNFYTIDVTNKSAEYKSSLSNLEATTYVSIVLVILQICLQFVGNTIFNHRLNILQCYLYSLGIIAMVWYIMDSQSYLLMYLYLVYFNLIPLVLELSSNIVSILYDRQKKWVS